ncbi:Response regulator protein TmoT [Anatilimnocola aggregata]|uniref:Response regulator protein TmoT n=1 Tax=Anatilimnocola aggregata TaxID=2528021 RepID=A0A517YJK3_9BACT|nr:response regulator [Anatilimnocola aggregata]QDU30404.1 Response regulator protein TmoT [Anatilimnocola aggregata]
MIYVVDDDVAVLTSLQALLIAHNYQVQCFASAEQFLQEVSLHRRGCVVTDVAMPGVTGVELVRKIYEAKSPLSVVVVTGVANVPMAVKLMEFGALTLLEKPYDAQQLLQAVNRGLTLSNQQSEQFQREQEVQRRLNQLTDEERSVMDRLLADKPNKSIAAELHLSLRTVDRRRQSVLEKLGVGSVPEMALMVGPLRTAQAVVRHPVT